MQTNQNNKNGHSNAPADADYDRLPYPSMPFPYTQPAHLTALATLYGLVPPEAETASVLELGCASGGNIIPLAARFPQARFLGIDLSQRHIRDGRQRIDALRLANIELRQGDLTEAELGRGRFDIIICHGVFSWVPRPAQDAILRICGKTLAANGLAIISYNVLPGWHLRSIVRDICLFHAGTSGSPKQRVAKARRALAEIAQSASKTEPYGLLLRSEAKRFAQWPAAYILGEFLSPENTPGHFPEFVARAQHHGLGFLCEAHLGAAVAKTLSPAAVERMKAFAGTDRIAEEQYKDFISGRPFRRSVLIRMEAERRVVYPPSPDRLRSLHFACRLNFESASADGGSFTYRDYRGRPVTTKAAAVNRALARLAEAYPSTLSLIELAGRGNGVAVQSSTEDESRVCNALFSLVSAGQASASSVALVTGRADAERPRVWPLARLEAAANQPWLTSLRHEPISLRTVTAELIAHLDGSNDRRALLAHVSNALKARKPADQTDDPSQLAAAAARHLDQVLAQLAEHALLEAT